MTAFDVDTYRTIPQLVRRAAERFADSEALVDGDTCLTFAEFAAAVDEAAAAFVALGIEPGDRVAIWAPNIWEWPVAAFGAHAAGAVLVPLNTRFKGHEAGYVLAKSRAKLLVTVVGFLGTDYVGLLQDAMGASTSGDDALRPVADLADLERIVLLRGDATGDAVLTLADALAAGRADASAADEANRRAAAVKADDLSDIVFTSGTTGNPKGVMETHGQTVRAFASWSDVVGLRHGDRYLVVNPFFHTFGYKAGLVASLIRGATVLPHAVFDAAAVLARIPQDRISVIPGPPTLYQMFLASPDRAAADLSSLRLAVTGAAAIPVSLVEAMRNELGFETVITGYGLTEVCGVATMCRFDDDPETIATTSGRAIPDVEVRTVDEDGNDVGVGNPGEVVVRGYNVMRGYLDDAEQTAATIDADGWLHTGDIGVLDARGYLRITDRLKDMYIRGGENVYPAEVESVLVAHPGVAQAAVIGVPDERFGEIGFAFVIAMPDAAPAATELIAWARERLANFKVPAHVAVVDALPLNATGKVTKFVLRDEAAKYLDDEATGGQE